MTLYLSQVPEVLLRPALQISCGCNNGDCSACIGGPNVLNVTVQTGRAVALLNGSSVAYNGTVDPGISTQYNESWNNYQGITQVGVM